MALAYGYETAARDDPMVKTVMSLVNILAKALSPERGVILSAFPFRKSYRFSFFRSRFTSAPSREVPWVVSRSWAMAGCCLREDSRSSGSQCPV